MAMTYDPTSADPGQIEKIPAGDILIDPNVRKDIRLDKSFISSIRVYGYQQHPVGYRDDDGKIHITVGQRRISAALEIGWPVIPIVVKPKRDAEHDRAEELRLLEQLAENEQRTALTPAEIAGGYKQLALLGVSEDQIARKTNTGKTTIKTALTVAESPAALAAASSKPITLDQAALIAEFDGDDAAVAELGDVAATKPEQLQHAAERIRNARLDTDAIARLREKAEKAGAEFVETFGEHRAVGLRELWKADDKERNRLTLDDVRKQPYTGLVARVSRTFGGTAGKNRGYELVFGLTSWKEQGLTTYGDRPPITDEEKAARRQKRIDKAEMIAATEVRRTWIRDELLAATRKTFPAGAMEWITRELWEAPGTLRSSYGSAARFALTTILGIEPNSGSYAHDPHTGNYVAPETLQISTLIDDSRGSMRLALAMAIARTEEIVGNPKADSFGQDPRTAAYLTQLNEWGYTLAPVEERIIALAAARKAAR